MKIAFLGDSLTWGEYGGSYVRELQTLRPADKLVNAGVGGNTVINLRRRVDEVLDQEPDGVFVMVGGNDAISYLYPETRRYYRRAQSIPEGVVTPEQFAATYRDLLTHIQVRHVLAWVGLPPVEYSRELVETLRHYNHAAKEIAEKLKVPVIDLLTKFVPDTIPARPPLNMQTINLIGDHIQSGWSDFEQARQAGGYTFTFDGLHLMPESARPMAEAIHTLWV